MHTQHDLCCLIYKLHLILQNHPTVMFTLQLGSLISRWNGELKSCAFSPYSHHLAKLLSGLNWKELRHFLSDTQNSKFPSQLQGWSSPSFPYILDHGFPAWGRQEQSYYRRLTIQYGLKQCLKTKLHRGLLCMLTTFPNSALINKLQVITYSILALSIFSIYKC